MPTVLDTGKRVEKKTETSLLLKELAVFWAASGNEERESYVSWGGEAVSSVKRNKSAR